MKSKGMSIICGRCRTKVYELSRDVEHGELISAEQFADVGYGAPKGGDAIVCPSCGMDLGESMANL